MMKRKVSKVDRLPSCVSTFSAGWLIVASLMVVGCGESVDPRVQQLRDRFLSVEPITGEVSVESTLKQLTAENAPPTVSVVLRGQISAGELPPWEVGQAAFALTDSTGHDGDTEHDPHTCPFCSRNITDYLASIFFRDKDGSVIQIDSRDLFDVEEKQTVIIAGEAKVGEDGTLQVDARQIHVRQ